MPVPLRRITIISTAFNKAVQLHRHLWTLNSQNYDHEDFRVIVIDDGSEDHTQAVLEAAKNEFPDLHLTNILTYRKPKGHFGGQGLAYNIGLRYAEEWRSEYVFQTGADMLIPTYGITKHMELQTDLKKRAWAIASNFNSFSREAKDAIKGNPPDPASDYDKLENLPDVLCGPNQYFIRPDRESLGNDYGLVASVPDRYDWRPAEKLLAQPEALTIEPLPESHIYIGLPGDMPCDRAHPEWPTWQSCRLEHWIKIGGYDESGTGHFWEDEQIRLRFLLYSDFLNGNGGRSFLTLVHPSPTVCCFHQPHIRQLSNDNRQTFLDNIQQFGFDVNRQRNIEWGSSFHEVVFANP